MYLHSKVYVITDKVIIMASQNFLSEIQSLIDSSSTKKKDVESNREANVPFNMRVNETLKNDFDKLCRENHTNMSREIKRYMRLAVANQEL